jgi:hypothetical protein
MFDGFFTMKHEEKLSSTTGIEASTDGDVSAFLS